MKQNVENRNQAVNKKNENRIRLQKAKRIRSKKMQP